MTLDEKDWELLQQQNSAAERQKTGEDEVEEMKNCVEMKKLLELNEAHRAWFLSASGPANYLLNKLETIQPLDRGYGGAQLVEQIKSTASELRFAVNNLNTGNYDRIPKWVDEVTAERLRKATGPSFIQEISKEVQNNRAVASDVERNTAALEFLITKYAERLKQRRPFYGGGTAQAGVAPPSGVNEIQVLTNLKDER